MRPAPVPNLPTAELRTVALSFASRGWHVIPLRPGTKRPAVPDHPAARCNRTDPVCRSGHVGWEGRATTNPNQIRRWWDHTAHGIGIATGPSNLVVVDLDTAKAGAGDQRSGAVVLDDLATAAGKPIPSTFTVATASGGWHLYFTAPPTGPALTNTASRIGPNIDTRAAGGYVVAPPTTIVSGHYTLTRNVEPIELPDWLHQLATATPRPARRADQQLLPIDRPASTVGRLGRYVAAAIEAETTRLGRAQPGERNHTLFTTAVALGQLVGANVLDHGTAIGALESAAAGHIAAGAFSDSEARATIASGIGRGMTEPRRLPADLVADTSRAAS